MLAVLLAGLLLPNLDDANTVRPTLVVVAASDYHAALNPWLDSRRDCGFLVQLMNPEEVIANESGAGAVERLREAIARRFPMNRMILDGEEDTGPFVLLVGDAPGPGEKLDASRLIPAALRAEKAHAGAKPIFATDNIYGDPDSEGRPRAAVGRWPVRTPQEVAVQVRKALQFERDQKPGLHRRDVTFLATTPNYDPALDPVLERMGMALINGQVKPHWGLRAMYSSPRSEYFPGPREMQRHLISWFEEPTPITLFAGHGYDQGVDFARFEQREYVVLDTDVALRIRGRRPGTLLWMSACCCGSYDLPPPHRGLAEALMMNEHGPTAVVAGSDVTSAWVNLLLCLGLARDVLEHPPSTLGGAFLRFKKAAFRPGPPLLKNMLLSMEPAERPELLPEDHQYLYNLLGDPTLSLRLPQRLNCEMTIVEQPCDDPGMKRFLVRGKIADWEAGVVSVSLTLDRMAMKERKPEPATLADLDGRLQTYMERFRMANDKTIAQGQVDLREGQFEVHLSVPDAQLARVRWLRLYAYSSPGEANIPWVDGVAAEPVKLTGTTE